MNARQLDRRLQLVPDDDAPERLVLVPSEPPRTGDPPPSEAPDPSDPDGRRP